MDEDELELLRSMYPDGDAEINLNISEVDGSGKDKSNEKKILLQLSVELKYVLVDVRVTAVQGTGEVGVALGRCRGLADSQAAALFEANEVRLR